MTIFVVSVVTVIVVSAICSLSEASLYAVRRPFVRSLTESGSAAGPVLEGFKDNMDRPITAILIVNTAANTAGASVAGAQATELFGGNAFLWFSAFFTLGVLLFSEIFPKILGVVYNKAIARAVALPWRFVITLLSPLVWAVGKVSALLKPSGQVFAAPEDEVVQLAQISAEEGSIMGHEAEMVRNVLALNDLVAKDVMTPRTVVFRLPQDLTLAEANEQVEVWTHSRIPLFDREQPDRWNQLVRATDILSGLADGRKDEDLKAIGLPLPLVSETTPGHVLLARFIAEQTHLFGVLDEFGGMAGVVSLEDVVESLIGQEIVDEVDEAADMREVARRQAIKRNEGRGLIPDPGAPEAPAAEGSSGDDASQGAPDG
jgi:CBS domain containing-hemolysin-like protein